MYRNTAPFVVLGATGAQGGAVAKAFERAQIPLRFVLRNPTPELIQSYGARNVEVVRGDMDDQASLEAAFSGASGVFSVQVIGPHLDQEYEPRTGRKIIDAAYQAGVAHFIHTSVARAGTHESFGGWAERKWGGNYWLHKAQVIAAAKARSFEAVTILKPAFMMENFARPRARWMFPSLIDGKLISAYAPHTKLDLVAAQDIGSFALAAYQQPARFNGAEIELAGDKCTIVEIAAQIARVNNQSLEPLCYSPEKALESGMSAGLVQNQEWSNIEGYRVDISALPQWGVALTRFDEWAKANADRIEIRA